jgi:hypothetical protein
VGTGGIIFMAILGLWAVYLVPVLVKERASRLDSRADDRTSAAVRVLERPAAQRPSRRVVLTVDRPVVSDRMPARPTRDLATALRRDARRSRVGVRLRAVAALVGLVALVVGGIAAGLGAVPWVVPIAGAAWLGGVVATGAVTTGLRRRRVAPVTRVPALDPRARRVATEVFDGRVARPAAARPVTATVDTAADPHCTEPAGEDDTWTPVEVPAPVYTTKSVSHRPPALPWSLPPVTFADAQPAWPAVVEQPEPTDQPAGPPAARADELSGDEADERRSAAG